MPSSTHSDPTHACRSTQNFARVQGRLKINPEDCLLRIRAKGPKGKVHCSIVALNPLHVRHNGEALALCLVAFKRRSVKWMSVVDVASYSTYRAKLVALLLQTLSSQDAQYFDELRPGGWTSIQIMHCGEICAVTPAFTLTLERRKTGLLTTTEIINESSIYSVEYEPEGLEAPLGDIVAYVLKEQLRVLGFEPPTP